MKTILKKSNLEELRCEVYEVYGCTIEQITDVKYVMETLEGDPEAIAYSINIMKRIRRGE